MKKRVQRERLSTSPQLDRIPQKPKSVPTMTLRIEPGNFAECLSREVWGMAKLYSYLRQNGRDLYECDDKRVIALLDRYRERVSGDERFYLGLEDCEELAKYDVPNSIIRGYINRENCVTPLNKVPEGFCLDGLIEITERALGIKIIYRRANSEPSKSKRLR